MTFFNEDQPLTSLLDDMALLSEVEPCENADCGWCTACLDAEDERFLLEEK